MSCGAAHQNLPALAPGIHPAIANDQAQYTPLALNAVQQCRQRAVGALTGGHWERGVPGAVCRSRQLAHATRTTTDGIGPRNLGNGVLARVSWPPGLRVRTNGWGMGRSWQTVCRQTGGRLVVQVRPIKAAGFDGGFRLGGRHSMGGEAGGEGGRPAQKDSDTEGDAAGRRGLRFSLLPALPVTPAMPGSRDHLGPSRPAVIGTEFGSASQSGTLGVGHERARSQTSPCWRLPVQVSNSPPRPLRPVGLLVLLPLPEHSQVLDCLLRDALPSS